MGNRVRKDGILSRTSSVSQDKIFVQYEFPIALRSYLVSIRESQEFHIINLFRFASVWKFSYIEYHIEEWSDFKKLSKITLNDNI